MKLLVNTGREHIQSKVTTSIMNAEYSLIIDPNDDSKEAFNEAIGLSTYSNNESTIAVVSEGHEIVPKRISLDNSDFICLLSSLDLCLR